MDIAIAITMIVAMSLGVVFMVIERWAVGFFIMYVSLIALMFMFSAHMSSDKQKQEQLDYFLSQPHPTDWQEAILK